MTTTTATTTSIHTDYTEHVTTPLNACSLESLPPVRVETMKVGAASKYEYVWPLMLGCYQLDEAKGERLGHLDLYAVPVPKSSSESKVDEHFCGASVESLGKPIPVLGGDNEIVVPGVLDGKWCPRSTNSPENEPLVYATAHASGEIQIHHIYHSIVKEDIQERDTYRQRQSPFGVAQVGRTTQDTAGLCLAVSWDFERSQNDKPPYSSRKIISSYSDGKVSIHNIHFATSEESYDDTVLSNCSLSAQLESIESWPAHKMFHSPAEVWAASFTTQEDVVLTGGDEAQLKIWDLRAGTTTSVQTIKDTFESGVTVLSPHPRREHWVACGSYDDTMVVLDLRSVSTSQAPKCICHSDTLGGGIWRIKWHPYQDDRLLVAAMHGGCKVIDLVEHNEKGRQERNISVHVHQKFTQHKSMAYGADWLVYQRPCKGRRLVEAAVSCSFYDQAMYLWNVNQ